MSVDSLTHAQRERLAFIDFSLQYFGHITRNDLIQRFKTGLAASTRDFSAYKSLAPQNLILQHKTKQYHRTSSFKPLFKHDPEAILTSLSRGFGNGISSDVQPSEQCFDAVRLMHPDPDIIAGLMRAIHNKQPVKCSYISLTSGKSLRTIVPHAIVNNGHRWHVRAFDRAHDQFRDFVTTRFTSVQLISKDINTHEGRSFDAQWNTKIELVLIPHPSLTQPQAVEMDYGMSRGKLSLTVRAALTGYLLRQWQVDCSQGARFSGQGCQLALENTEVLHDVENTSLAPGFKVVQQQLSTIADPQPV